ncbi:hypothetical protein MPSEU_000010400 [Mayamaea pseudoterrestris]|nr:hypothetical protein MPSEU_000010400 [Mayamaea pseudoterrestris]
MHSNEKSRHSSMKVQRVSSDESSDGSHSSMIAGPTMRSTTNQRTHTKSSPHDAKPSTHKKTKPTKSSGSSGRRREPFVKAHKADLEGRLVKVPHENDVLSGRGGKINAWKGNLMFRTLVDQRKQEYQHVDCSREDKVLIATQVIEAIVSQEPSGRFLIHLENPNKVWYEMNEKAVFAKVTQALRERKVCNILEEVGNSSTSASTVHLVAVKTRAPTPPIVVKAAPKARKTLPDPPGLTFKQPPIAVKATSFAPPYMMPSYLPPFTISFAPTVPAPAKANHINTINFNSKKSTKASYSSKSTPMVKALKASTEVWLAVKVPFVNDVLSGRGGKVNQWPGNTTFRALIEPLRQKYQAPNMTREAKNDIAQHVIQSMYNLVPPSRFLIEMESDVWYEMNEQAISAKVTQALRERHVARAGQKKLAQGQATAATASKHRTQSSVAAKHPIADVQVAAAAAEEERNDLASQLPVKKRYKAAPRPLRKDWLPPLTEGIKPSTVDSQAALVAASSMDDSSSEVDACDALLSLVGGTTRRCHAQRSSLVS